ncbi:MAG: hypothetical protein ACOCRO_02335 [Halanaerobiales bacterium]
MKKILWTSPNGKWKIVIISWRDWERIAVTDDWFMDYPIQYDNGHIVYDYPERIPQYVKEQVYKVMDEVKLETVH